MPAPSLLPIEFGHLILAAGRPCSLAVACLLHTRLIDHALHAATRCRTCLGGLPGALGIHRAAERDDGVFDVHLEVGRVDVPIVRQRSADVIGYPFIGALPTLGTAALMRPTLARANG